MKLTISLAFHYQKIQKAVSYLSKVNKLPHIWAIEQGYITNKKNHDEPLGNQMISEKWEMNKNFAYFADMGSGRE